MGQKVFAPSRIVKIVEEVLASQEDEKQIDALPQKLPVTSRA